MKAKSYKHPNRGAQALSRVPDSMTEIAAVLAPDSSAHPRPAPPPRGARLLASKSSVREIADRLGVSKSLAGYWLTGERRPSSAHIEALERLYGVPVAAWEDSPLPPWLRRMALEGLASVENDPDELERTAVLVAETVAETLVKGEIAMFEDVLLALRKYA